MTKVLTDILQSDPKSDPEIKIFNFLSASPTADFYDTFYGKSPAGSNTLDLLSEVKLHEIQKGTAYKVMEEIISFLEKKLPPEAILIELGGGMYQQRSANAYKRFPHYFPLDIGYSNIKNYVEKYGKEGIVADATNLPFKRNSIDCILTHTFLEHPIEPQKVLEEIIRVLKPGGIVIHNDAWFCRWWHHYGFVGLKKFKNLSLREKLIWSAAKFTELPIIRIPPIILKRLIRNFTVPKNENSILPYKKLTPNYTLHLGCDEDAASSIDPVDVIRFYESNNFELVSKLSFRSRLFYPNKYIVLRKIY